MTTHTPPAPPPGVATRRKNKMFFDDTPYLPPPTVREDLVRRIRIEIDLGLYESPDKVQTLLARLAKELD